MDSALHIDYRLAFELAPIGLVLSRHRSIVDCNHRLCEMFDASREQLIGQSFQLLYPSADEYERTGARIEPLLNRHGSYSDERMMKRVAGRHADELFWCHVSGRALNRDRPHEAGIWSFEDLSTQRVATSGLTPREREVAALLLKGRTSKQIGQTLGISHRTAEVHRASLLHKYQAHTTAELVHKLMGG